MKSHLILEEGLGWGKDKSGRAFFEDELGLYNRWVDVDVDLDG